MARILKEPLLHFTLIGALIWALYGFFGSSEEDAAEERLVRISAAEVEWLAESFTSRWNRPPTRDELDGLVRARIEEEVLYREALAMGLGEGDQVIRRRLGQKLEFAISDVLTPAAPERAELAAWFVERVDDYTPPPRYWLTQIYLDPGRRGDGVLEDAARLRDELNNGEASTDDVRSLSDSVMLESDFSGYSAAELTRHFGRDFVDGLSTLEPGVWHAPVLSGYGVHVVRIADMVVAPPPEFDAVAERVRADWTQSQRETLNAQYRESLMAAYEIEVEEGSVPRLVASEPPETGRLPVGEPASGTEGRF